MQQGRLSFIFTVLLAIHHRGISVNVTLDTELNAWFVNAELY